MKPAFIGLGAQKCASTWLHHILAAHPQVLLPDVKEVDFFSYHFDHGYQWYERKLPTGGVDRRVGEVSPSYLHDHQVPGRVKGYAPDVRLLVTLRDPVERALSNHRHEVRLGHLAGDDLSFEAGLANNPMYVEQGLYGKHLGNWLTHFPADQLHVILVDDIRERPSAVVRELFRFLGVDDSFQPPALTNRFNPSFANRSPALARLKDRVYQLSRAPGLERFWSAAAALGARRAYRRLNVVRSDVLIPPARPQTLATLRARFDADLCRLESLLGRDLTPWRCAESSARENRTSEQLS